MSFLLFKESWIIQDDMCVYTSGGGGMLSRGALMCSK